MRTLEARFHPGDQLDGSGIVVGRVHCGRGKATVEPQPGPPDRAAADTMLRKLQYLVDICAPTPFERLRQLRSRYWSFVEVTASAASDREEQA